MEEGAPRRLGGGGSIFQLEFEVIADSTSFWLLCLTMIIFMIIIDRLQWALEHWAGNDFCKRRFMERINAEMMMFGIVAITLFLFQYVFLKLDDKGNDQFHYVDLLCSIAACTLIFFGGCLMLFMQWMTRHYRNFGQKTIDQHLEFYVMAGTFMAKWCVMPGFSFAYFLRESLGLAICELITIDWFPWLFMVPPALIGLIVTASTDADDIANETKVLVFVLYNVFWLVLMLAFTGWILWRRKLVREYVGMKDKSSIRGVVEQFSRKKAGEKQHLPKVAGNFAKRLAEVAKENIENQEEPKLVKAWITTRLMQGLSLGTTMNSSMYLCHFAYAIGHVGLSGSWQVFCILPIVTCYCLIPVIMVELALVNAILSPDHEILDRVTDDISRFSSDCEHILQQLENAAKEGFLPLDELAAQVNNSAPIGRTRHFQAFLRSLHVCISTDRLKRIKQKMDADADGVLTITEFFNAVNGDPPDATEKQGAMQLLERLRGLEPVAPPEAQASTEHLGAAEPSSSVPPSAHTGPEGGTP
mmetsp:Transcript_110757/g.336749  ORF Transcript_110757/g.336749 Transcript_110757/m.336749 type:complete len:529 (+) Transcript_110757:2-1588(+)